MGAETGTETVILRELLYTREYAFHNLWDVAIYLENHFSQQPCH